MYKKRRLIQRGVASSNPCNPFTKGEVRLCRPFSFYVRGGVDLNGDTSRVGPPSHFDDSESISSGDVDIATDPTLSKLDIAAYASGEFVKASEARAAKQISQTE